MVDSHQDLVDRANELIARCNDAGGAENTLVEGTRRRIAATVHSMESADFWAEALLTCSLTVGVVIIVFTANLYIRWNGLYYY